VNQQPDDSGRPDYLTEVTNLAQTVEDGHTLIKEGNTIDLANLETQVADLCRRMSLIPPDNADAVTVAIQQLLGRLGTLSDAIQAQVAENK